MKIPSIPYVSPSLRFDQEARVVVMEYRNAETGKIARQIPSEEAVRRAATAEVAASPPRQPEAAAPADEPAAAAPRISIDV